MWQLCTMPALKKVILFTFWAAFLLVCFLLNCQGLSFIFLVLRSRHKIGAFTKQNVSAIWDFRRCIKNCKICIHAFSYFTFALKVLVHLCTKSISPTNMYHLPKDCIFMGVLLSSCQNSVVITVPSLFWEKRLQSFTSETSNLGQFYVFSVQKRVDIMVISPSFDFMESFSQLCLAKLEKNSKKGKKSGFISVEIIKTKPKQSFL